MKTKVIFTGLFSLLLLAGCQSTQQTTPSSSAKESTTTTVSKDKTNQSTVSSQSNGNESENMSPEIRVSVERAIELFEETYPDTVITSLELDSNFGSYFYTIEGVDDQKEYKVRIDAKDGIVEAKQPEALDPDEQQGKKKAEDALDLSNLLPIDKATTIAVKKVGGGRATDWDLEKEVGTTYWDVKVKNGNQVTNVKLNSQTGEVLATEQED
ncbi:hypothetical protein A5844_000068 [Enterococcus sp. 10A9_DIV0425]|uniref:PepSY domain-containing protein n=1 Tax=Candidatus Enterococcus wittei TaxID=1987383 RepID=A0A2C9XR18_9ENTE|nr:PepSY domain-containing protein [Enterococcus sp. 10A9_DIV0425]OTP11854.1 hypothetical protein A5844_000068 [Enterococcus sp. 10A9_DIV0425]